MRRLVSRCFFVWALTLSALGQSQPAANRVLGDVVKLDPAAHKIVLKTSSGEVVASFSDNTEFLQVEPGATNLSNAKPVAVNDIVPADRVLARGTVSGDGKSIAARQIIVMKSAAISQKHQQEREEWAQRGVGGTVTALSPQTREITIKQHQRDGAHQLVIEAGKSVKFFRYAPDSVKFSDARNSSFKEVEVGDELRALGQKSEDGTQLTAETVVFGSFRMAGGTIKSIDPKGEILINDIPTKAPLRVVINSDSQLKRVPPRLAEMLSGGGAAGMWRSGRPGTGPGTESAQPAPAAAERRPGPQGAQPESRGSGGMGPNGPDVSRMIERMPAIALTDLKPGDFVLVSSTKGADPSRVTAITLVAGAEAILAARSEASGGGPDMNIGLAADIFDFGIGMPAN
jgi:hypothetical protein